MKLKYLNTVLRYYRALTLFPCYLLATWSRPLCDMIVVPLLMHNICHTKDKGPDTRRKCPRSTLLQYLTPQLIIPAPDNHFEDIRDADPIDSLCLSARLYFVPFIYCHYTHSASYDLILHPSCDNEGCRF